VLVSDLMTEHDIGTMRRLNDNGRELVNRTADRTAHLVDELLGKQWDRRAGEFVGETPAAEEVEPVEATCSCGSGIPVQKVSIDGQVVTLIALPAIFQQFHEQGKAPGNDVTRELLNLIKVYNPVPAEQEATYLAALEREYTAYCAKNLQELA
jgi:hypothetical protein